MQIKGRRHGTSNAFMLGHYQSAGELPYRYVHIVCLENIFAYLFICTIECRHIQIQKYTCSAISESTENLEISWTI